MVAVASVERRNRIPSYLGKSSAANGDKETGATEYKLKLIWDGRDGSDV